MDNEKERESIRMLRKLSLDLKELGLRFGGYIKAESVSHELDYWLDVYEKEEKMIDVCEKCGKEKECVEFPYCKKCITEMENSDRILDAKVK